MLCATVRAMLCEGRPVRSFTHCHDGRFFRIGPGATKPQCFVSADDFAAEVAERREFLVSIYPAMMRGTANAAFAPEPCELGLSIVDTYFDKDASVWVGRSGEYVSQGTTREEAIEAVEDAIALSRSAAMHPDNEPTAFSYTPFDPETARSRVTSSSAPKRGSASAVSRASVRKLAPVTKTPPRR